MKLTQRFERKPRTLLLQVSAELQALQEAVFPAPGAPAPGDDAAPDGFSGSLVVRGIYIIF